MAVFASAEVQWYSAESAKVYASGVHSGIIGHPGTNTYHQSIENLPNQNGYTNFWPNDKAPPGGWSRQHAVGDDLSMNRADMIEDWRRHKRVFDEGPSDPRQKYIAEYIGTPDGITAYRLDFADGSVEESSPDHTWHAHGACWRRYYNSLLAQQARLSVRKGESKQQWIDSQGADVDTRQNALLVATAYRLDSIHKDLVEVTTNAETTGAGVAGEDNISRKARVDMEQRLQERMTQLEQRLVALENKPPVQPAPVDAATLATAMQDPAVVAVMEEAARAGAEQAEDS